MDKLIYFSQENGLFAIVEHEEKWYCPSKFIKLENNTKRIFLFQEPEMNFYKNFISEENPKVTELKKISIAIQYQPENDEFFAYCKELDTIGII